MKVILLFLAVTEVVYCSHGPLPLPPLEGHQSASGEVTFASNQMEMYPPANGGLSFPMNIANEQRGFKVIMTHQ